MSIFSTAGKRNIPDKVERPAYVDLEGVPPRIRIFAIQHFDEMKQYVSQQQKKKKGGSHLA